jgi:hypothetical protein
MALDALHGGGLAGAVGTDQAENLALDDVERDVIDGGDAAVSLAKVPDGDDRNRLKDGEMVRRREGEILVSHPLLVSWSHHLIIC